MQLGAFQAVNATCLDGLATVHIWQLGRPCPWVGGWATLAPPLLPLGKQLGRGIRSDVEQWRQI